MTTFISFYTQDWQYPKHAKRLSAECDNLKMPYIIQELPSTGSYLKNTCMKPQFILDKLRELKSPVLWVDVDASLLRFPYMSYYKCFNYDFAAKKMSPERKRTWHVGTMWFNYTPNMIEFMEQWVKKSGNLSDESALEKTWQEFGHLLRTANLPSSYFRIVQKGKKLPSDTVIAHRISDGPMKLREMSIAKEKREKGEW